MIWDHTIELSPNIPKILPGCLLPLNQQEITEMSKFVTKHLERGTIHKS